MTIRGSGFTGATLVDFGSTKATKFVVDSATLITATSPAGTGVVDVTVTTPNGTSSVNRPADDFSYAPVVTGIGPSQGTAAGGTTVTITGTNLENFTAVKFGTTAATSFVSKSATKIVVKSPPLVVNSSTGTETVDVTVTTAGGVSCTSSADKFTYVAAPTVTGLSPASGSTAGNTLVTIQGANLANATSVTFGTTTIPTTSFVSDTATSIMVDSPPATAGGPVYVAVTTAGGTSNNASADTFTYGAGASRAVVSQGPVALHVNDLALLALTGQPSPSAAIHGGIMANLMA